VYKLIPSIPYASQSYTCLRSQGCKWRLHRPSRELIPPVSSCHGDDGLRQGMREYFDGDKALSFLWRFTTFTFSLTCQIESKIWFPGCSVSVCMSVFMYVQIFASLAHERLHRFYPFHLHKVSALSIVRCLITRTIKLKYVSLSCGVAKYQRQIILA
jgi:hypothetical protein